MKRNVSACLNGFASRKRVKIQEVTMAQRVVVQLNRPIDEAAFQMKYDENREPGSPQAKFEFSADHMSMGILLYTSNATWPEDSFRQALQMTLRKAAPGCEI